MSPLLNRRNAGANGPQRDPTTLNSLITIWFRSIFSGSAMVVFSTRRPRGYKCAMQVLFRKNDIVGKNTVVMVNSKHGPALAVCAPASIAQVTITARAVDFPNNGFPGEFPARGYHLAHEFMTGNAFERHVSLKNLKICISYGRV